MSFEVDRFASVYGQCNEHSVCIKHSLIPYQLSGYKLRNKDCAPWIYLSSQLPRSQLCEATCITFVIVETDTQLARFEVFTATLHQIMSCGISRRLDW